MSNPNWKRQTLQEALDELEATDPDVAAAAADYDRAAAKIIARASQAARGET